MSGVPVFGSIFPLAALSTLLITANLSIGYAFSTIAQNQLQAMQMSTMFFLPNILLSAFIFPFAGMPAMGALDRRGPAAHALFAHRARHHARRLRPCRLAL
jgi:ABC-2 type transport system permease protein